jgi:uncharacterized protein (TIGR02594 family)
MPMGPVEQVIGGGFYKLGSSGSPVRVIQLRLAALGFPLKGTGYFGNATDTAVETFQRGTGFLKVDGEVGSLTARALDNAALPTLAKLEEVKARPLWLEAGLATLGTKEGPGSRDNPVIIDWAKDEGGAIARDYTHDSIPWCALWANHILTKVSLKGTETLWALDFNPDLMQRRIGRRWPAVELRGPAVGAFAPMLRDGGGHIINITGRDQNGHVMGLGGNQSNAVTNAPFARARLNKGFWWPEGVPLPKSVGFETLPVVRSDGRVSTAEA